MIRVIISSDFGKHEEIGKAKLKVKSVKESVDHLLIVSEIIKGWGLNQFVCWYDILATNLPHGLVAKA